MILVYRLAAWLTVIYIIIAVFFSIIIGYSVGLIDGGTRIDWNLVPSPIRPSLWLAQSLLWFPAIVIATLPAPVAFFRLAAGKPSNGILVFYTLITTMLMLVMIAVPVSLAAFGTIRTSSSSWIAFTAKDVIDGIIPAGVLAIPLCIGLWVIVRQRRTAR